MNGWDCLALAVIVVALALLYLLAARQCRLERERELELREILELQGDLFDELTARDEWRGEDDDRP